MFISQIRAALPALSDREYATSMELASLGISLRDAARLMQIHYLRIPRRQFRTARIRGERKRLGRMLGMPALLETLNQRQGETRIWLG